MRKLMRKSLIIIITSTLCLAKVQATESVEEARINKARTIISTSTDRLDGLNQRFSNQWKKTLRYDDAVDLVGLVGRELWRQSKSDIAENKHFDDRVIYWQRLKLSKVIRTQPPAFKLTSNQKNSLLLRFEETSRGIDDLEYRHQTDLKVLLTGFDPFLLDRYIDQSNPSGVTALLLDGKVIKYRGITAEINTFLVPVRYGDFDQGFVEKNFSPFFALNSVDLIATVSMGRKNFDLERFPGKRRSASTPGNLNVYSGGSSKNPIVAQLHNRPLPGPEFVEFSLPYSAFMTAPGNFKINVNPQVTTLKKTFKPSTLKELKNSIAVSGSGGGYLSNEISYRSIRLRNELNSSVPTGHIHTPRIERFEPEINKAITEQITEMLRRGLPELITSKTDVQPQKLSDKQNDE